VGIGMKTFPPQQNLPHLLSTENGPHTCQPPLMSSHTNQTSDQRNSLKKTKKKKKSEPKITLVVDVA